MPKILTALINIFEGHMFFLVHFHVFSVSPPHCYMLHAFHYITSRRSAAAPSDSIFIEDLSPVFLFMEIKAAEKRPASSCLCWRGRGRKESWLTVRSCEKSRMVNYACKFVFFVVQIRRQTGSCCVLQRERGDREKS